MTQETINQIQNLIGLSAALLLLIMLAGILITYMLLYSIKTHKDEQIRKKDKEIKELKERLETKTEVERLRYEHEQFIKKYKKENKK